MARDLYNKKQEHDVLPQQSINNDIPPSLDPGVSFQHYQRTSSVNNIMKVLALLSLFVGVTCAFVSKASPKLHRTSIGATAELDGLIGVDIESGKKIFDPVGLAQWGPVDYLRKAELSNGRSAMLAFVGWYWPTLLGTFTSDDVTTKDPIKAIFEADSQWWAQFLLFCGIIEAYKYNKEQEGFSYTGEGPAVFDWTGQWAKYDAKQKEDIRLKELKNGRLAMIAMAALFSDYFIPGSVPGMPHL